MAPPLPPMSSTAAYSAKDNVLETSIMDKERPGLLQRISEEGGYAYVRMESIAAGGDMRAAEATREMAWEQLHSGPWHAVVPIWRDAYAMACLNVAKLHYAAAEYGLALRALDLGLIMGGLTLRNDLNSAINKASKKACSLTMPMASSNPIKLVSEEVDSVQMVSKKTSLSLEGFLQDYVLPGLPVIICDGMTHWPAKSKWNNINYLKGVAGLRTVPVEVGKNYLCSEWKQELITFSDFLDRIQSNKHSSGETTYLAQHPLFDQILELRNDIIIPDYCFVGGGEMRSLNAWFGPAGTVTPLHHDPHHNILSQIVGKKYVRLYSALLSHELYPHAESMLSNSSQVDLDDVDEKEFPEVSDLEFVDCILEEGEMLYIPPKWWHYVRSLTTSFSVSFWWENNPDSPES